MKKFTLTIAISLGFMRLETKASAFLDAVNNAWKANDCNQVLALANAESQKVPVNPEAYIVLLKYNMHISRNYIDAKNNLEQLKASIGLQQPQNLSNIESYYDRFMQSYNPTMLNPATPDNLARLHKLFPDEFPVISLLVLISPS